MRLLIIVESFAAFGVSGCFAGIYWWRYPAWWRFEPGRVVMTLALSHFLLFGLLLGGFVIPGPLPEWLWVAALAVLVAALGGLLRLLLRVSTRNRRVGVKSR